MSAMETRKRHLRMVSSPTWHFCLYVIGGTPRSLLAQRNLQKFCDDTFPGHYKIEVVDVAAQPRLALEENIVALPMLVRKEPKPIRKVVGDLSNRERLLAGMDVPAQV